MQSQTSAADPADEEVAFWRSFIACWAREKEEPVPLRAWEALGYAQKKNCASGMMRSFCGTVYRTEKRSSSPAPNAVKGASSKAGAASAAIVTLRAVTSWCGRGSGESG